MQEKILYERIGSTFFQAGKYNYELIIGEEYTFYISTSPSGQRVNVTSSNTNIAAIAESDGYTSATIIAKVAGTANINVTFGTYTISCIVTVYDVFSQDGVTINGVTWATRNVDAPGTFAAKATDRGMDYQWNRRIGWSYGTIESRTSSPTGHSWDNTIPTGISWEAANDPSPTGWRVPTLEELQKLRNTGYTEAIINGILGCKFGNGNNTIFLPSTRPQAIVNTIIGYIRQGEAGNYWSATESGSSNAYYLTFSFAWDTEKMYQIYNPPASTRSAPYPIRSVKK